MRVTIISDTHTMHEDLRLRPGDLLIHCGDTEDLFSDDRDALERLDAWFARQPFQQIICIGGNHDRVLEQRVLAGMMPFQNAIYLQDSDFTFGGHKFYGAPWVPMLHGHAFFAEDSALEAAWARIPEDVDVLITHTPPLGILDVSRAGTSLGCPHLSDHVRRISPKIHCFGHVHASSGKLQRDATTFINASCYPGRSGRLKRPVELALRA